jgi:acyl-CoA dehydrogenase
VWPSQPIHEERSVEVKRNVYREDHEMLRETARRFFERECLPRQAQWDEAGCVDRETWLKAAKGCCA